MPAHLVTLVRELYAMSQAGKLNDAEAQWVLRVVLPVYGKSLNDLARWVQAQD